MRRLVRDTMMKNRAANAETYQFDNKIDIATLLASSIHDIKNSLGVLLHEIDDLADDCEPGSNDPQQDKLSRLRNNARNISTQLIQLLTLYRFENGSYTLHPSHVNISEFFEDRQAEKRMHAEQTGARLEYQCAADLYWNMDRELVASVINNAIDNALRFAGHKVRLEARTEAECLVLEVVDDGPGFSDEMLESVSGHGGKINMGSGDTGLGIYFASEVVRRHMNADRVGHIRLSNDGIDGGARFSVYIP